MMQHDVIRCRFVYVWRAWFMMAAIYWYHLVDVLEKYLFHLVDTHTPWLCIQYLVVAAFHRFMFVELMRIRHDICAGLACCYVLLSNVT